MKGGRKAEMKVRQKGKPERLATLVVDTIIRRSRPRGGRRVAREKRARTKVRVDWKNPWTSATTSSINFVLANISETLREALTPIAPLHRRFTPLMQPKKMYNGVGIGRVVFFVGSRWRDSIRELLEPAVLNQSRSCAGRASRN